MNCELRDAEKGDRAAILELMPRLADFEVPLARSSQQLWEGDAEMLLAHLAGERSDCVARVALGKAGDLLGFALVSLREELLSRRPSAHLEALAIARSAEGQGVGRALLADAEQQAMKRGAKSLTLHVFAANRRARRLYDAAGFSGELMRYAKFFPGSPEAARLATLPTEAEELLTFWFGGERAPQREPGAVIAQRQAKLWWQKDTVVDRAVRRRFEPSLLAAERGELADWRASARSHLALILLFDQVPRNIYRGSPRSFAFDARARSLCREGVASRVDEQLQPIERLFFYLPLEHSEELADQRSCLELMTQLADEVKAAPGALAPHGEKSQAEVFDGFVDFARRHLAVIERFGRFPHRNEILGRESTAEENEFLTRPDSSF